MIPREVWQLDTRRIGRRVLVFDRLDSTSNVAASLADSADNDGVAVLAGEQTSGRGQHGRSWTCPAGSGVLLSVLLFPPAELRRPAILTAWAAVSVCETIRELTELPARIKWPNDIFIQDRKVCGILIEQRRGTVAGIGLNVNQSADAFATAGLTEAASLAVLSGRQLDCAVVTRRLLHHLDEQYNALGRGDLATLEASWKWRLGLLGREVVAECADGLHRGRLRDLSWIEVELEQPDGTIERLRPETILHLFPA
jgi:BirA family transcriptional regulator, biotin operon repressor / biotin---[acetyl-CoA-carboxylase] ligase